MVLIIINNSSTKKNTVVILEEGENNKLHIINNDFKNDGFISRDAEAHRPFMRLPQKFLQALKKTIDKNFQMDQKLQRISLSFVEASRRSQIPADQDSFTKKSPGARIVSPGQRIRRPSMEDLFELDNENGIHQRRIMTPNLTKIIIISRIQGDGRHRPVSWRSAVTSARGPTS